MTLDELRIEVYESNNNFLLIKDDSALVCDKSNGAIQITSSKILSKEYIPKCHGVIYGVIGKLKLHPSGTWHLLLIRNAEQVAKLPDNSEVFRVKRILFLPLVNDPVEELDIEPCPLHASTDKPFPIQDMGKPFIRAVQSTLKTYASTRSKVSWPRREPGFTDREEIEREKFETRMQEEVTRLFQEDGGFYFSPSGDLTNRQQVLHGEAYRNLIEQGVPLWKRVDERFFWNQSLLSDILHQVDVGACKSELARPFLLPIMQGYIEMSPILSVTGEVREVVNSSNNVEMRSSTASSPAHVVQLGMICPDSNINNVLDKEGDPHGLSPSRPISKSATTASLSSSDDISGNTGPTIRMWVISRRCKYQAGIRYRRRGVNKDGYVANYVESEQVIRVNSEPNPHFISFCQLRGSIPVYWSQSGIKYRPPIRLEKSEEENRVAFQKHFDRDVDAFGHITTVSLVGTSPDRSEKKISDAYLKHLLLYPRNEHITHVIFDFHDFCPGTNFDNVSVLLRGLEDILKEMNYCWADSKGILMEQKGIFRVNCMDCLDRTNVVQVLFALLMLEVQLRRLGLLNPETTLPGFFNHCILHMWGNNGDAISTQYAGTIAMKGDYTRTKERTATGMMRDGISSMTRYYLRYREIRMQAAVDLFIQNQNSSELLSMQRSSEDTSTILREKEDNIKRFAEECRKLCLKPDEESLTECILIACDERDGETREMNTIALITTKHYYIIRTDKVFCIQIPISACTKIETGLQPSMFRTRQMCMRIHYRGPSTSSSNNKIDSSPKFRTSPNNDSPQQGSSFFLTFRQPNLRLFNNMLIPIRDEEDMTESLRAVVAYFATGALALDQQVSIVEREGKLDRLRFRPPPSEYFISSITSDKIYACLPRPPVPRRRTGNMSITNGEEKKPAVILPESKETPSLKIPWQSLPKTFFKDRLANIKMWPSEIGAKLNLRNAPPTTRVSNVSESPTQTVTEKDLVDRSPTEEASGSEWEDEFIQKVIDNAGSESDSDDLVLVESVHHKGSGAKTDLPQQNALADSKNGSPVDLLSVPSGLKVNKVCTKALSDSEVEAVNQCKSAGSLKSQSSRRNSLHAQTMVHIVTHNDDLFSDTTQCAPTRTQTLASVLSAKGQCHDIGLDLSKKDIVTSSSTIQSPSSTITINVSSADENVDKESIHSSKVNIPNATLKYSFSETALSKRYPQPDEHGITCGTKESISSYNMRDITEQSIRYSSIVRLPEITVANQRHAQRLREKQQYELIEFENLRKAVVPKTDVRMNVIIF